MVFATANDASPLWIAIELDESGNDQKMSGSQSHANRLTSQAPSLQSS